MQQAPPCVESVERTLSPLNASVQLKTIIKYLRNDWNVEQFVNEIDSQLEKGRGKTQEQPILVKRSDIEVLRKLSAHPFHDSEIGEWKQVQWRRAEPTKENTTPPLLIDELLVNNQ